MDIDQAKMQNVGFFGLYKESIKTIFAWKKIFAQITLTFLLPVSFLFLAQIIIADILHWRIDHYELYENHYYYHRRESFAWIGYLIFKFVYFTFLSLYSPLSIAAIVYTIATVYTGGDVALKNVFKIMPRVWKRLALTLLWAFFGFFIYNVVVGVVVAIWANTILDTTFGYALFWLFFSLYCIGFIYITAVWQLASVVTVLESSYGLEAMRKSKDLIKAGKKLLSWFVFFVLYCVFAGIWVLFNMFLWNYTFFTIIIGLVCLFLLMNLLLVGYVAQTMLYLVCKSYHCESIDKVGLSTQLKGYLSQFEPVFKPNKDVKLEQTQSFPQVKV
ncbi:hypothetical protein L1987_07547 [Smallanthus sonchifolius]|uniref:Uncharacterized protein n=1 Tax=Smallanthus sonchifolius TaxID=185202 RepID=A0ACB9K0L6_9ASTR|nr:hypothetical protein L1987_07547 [Smallanthus sonchifolius]